MTKPKEELMSLSRRNILKALATLPLIPLSRPVMANPDPLLLRINLPGPGSLPFLPIELIPLLGIDRNLNASLLIRYFPSGVGGLEDMLGGNAQFSAQGFTVLYSFFTKGKKALALAPLSGQVPPYGIVARIDLRDKIKSVSDLKGRAIGISVGTTTSKTYSQQVAETFLAANGVSPNEVRWVPTGQNWNGQFGALSSKSVDAVYCEEPFMSGLVRSKVGFVVSDLSDPRMVAKLPGAAHLRAALTTSPDLLQRTQKHAEIMVRMLSQSLAWLLRASAGEVVDQLHLRNKNERTELIDVLTRHRGMFAPDPRFSRTQIEATAQFMRASGVLTDPGFKLETLIDSRFAGIKP